MSREEEYWVGEHELAEPRYFDELEVGEVFRIPSRTVTEAHFSAFQAVSGDNHPIHYDVQYCRAQGHTAMLAHGFQVLSYTAAGAGMFPHVVGKALIGFIEQSSKFLKPVYVGDTVYPELEITALDEQQTTGVVTVESRIHNQRGELCMDGIQKYLVRKRS